MFSLGKPLQIGRRNYELSKTIPTGAYNHFDEDDVWVTKPDALSMQGGLGLTFQLWVTLRAFYNEIGVQSFLGERVHNRNNARGPKTGHNVVAPFVIVVQ